MSRIVEVTCPTCGFKWQEDADWHRDNESIHALPRAASSEPGAEEFSFRCPQDGTWVRVAVPRGS